MCGHRKEILTIAGGQGRLEPDRDSGNATVEVTPRTSAREIEEVSRLLSVAGFKRYDLRNQTPRKGFRSRTQWAAEEFSPCDGADPERLACVQPLHQLGLLRSPGDERIDQEVGIEEHHQSTLRLPAPVVYGRFPGCGGLLRQTGLRLELAENVHTTGRNLLLRRMCIHPLPDLSPLDRRQSRDGSFDLWNCAHPNKMPGMPLASTVGSRTHKIPEPGTMCMNRQPVRSDWRSVPNDVRREQAGEASVEVAARRERE